MNEERSKDVRKEFLGRGWARPIAVDRRTGQVACAEYEEDIRQSVLIILKTAPGERVMRPNFGCGIHDLVYTPLDSTTMQRIRSLVEEALRHYEARVDVLNVNVDEDASIHGRLLIEVEYRVRLTNQLSNLVFPFYFREGGRS